MKMVVKRDSEEISNVAAVEIMNLINEKPNSILGLATGSTPIGTYKRLIEFYGLNKIDFSKVTTFNLDEYRGLNGEHPQSYRYFMNNTLLNHINIDKKNTYIPNGVAKDIDKECKDYDNLIESKGGIDLQILGIGNNGHIGFNEPGEFLYVGTHLTNLSEDTIKANSRFFNSVEEVPTQAITMGIGGIMKAKRIILLASGKNKANIVSELFKEKLSTRIPASMLHVHPNCTIILDEEAASLLNKEFYI